MPKEKYVYDRKKFCIPVTKAEPLSSIQFIIDDFIEKKITFCIDGEGESWEIWRYVEDNDSDKIKKKRYPRNSQIPLCGRKGNNRIRSCIKPIILLLKKTPERSGVFHYIDRIF